MGARYTATEVAKFLAIAAYEDNKPLTHLQLQYLCYRAWCCYYALHQKALFDDYFFASAAGPRLYGPYYCFFSYGSMPITPSSARICFKIFPTVEETCLRPADQKFLRFILSDAPDSVRRLYDLYTGADSPWRKNWSDHLRIIDRSSITDTLPKPVKINKKEGMSHD